MLRLSVITPTLGQGRFIERTIKSVLDQGYENLEYIVVDGGSTDQTVEILERYDDRIDWWVSEPDEGQTHALAKGLERASGDVIAYINSDDYYLPGAFQTATSALERSNAGWVAGSATDVDEHDRPTDIVEWVPHPPEYYEHWPRGRHHWVCLPWAVAQPACFWRREMFDAHGGFRRDMHFAFDAEFMLRLVFAGERPLLLPDEYLCARVLHPAAKSFELQSFRPDFRALKKTFRPQLTPRERILARLYPVTEWLRTHRPRRPKVRQDIVYPTIRFAGDMLEHVPERIRPKIRTRDRG